MKSDATERSKAPGHRRERRITVERTLAGDRDAYRVLVERHSRSVFRLAYRMTGIGTMPKRWFRRHFCAGIRSWGNLRRDRISGRGVYRIAANYAIDRMRQRQKEEARRETPRAGRQRRDGKRPIESRQG